MKRLLIPQKLVCEKFYAHEKILCTRNCRSKLIKNLLPEKRKENVNQTTAIQIAIEKRYKLKWYIFINMNQDVFTILKNFFVAY